METNDDQKCSEKKRIGYIEKILEKEKGELSELEKEVLKSIKEQEIISLNLETDKGGEIAVGDRIADRVASFGGSWRFIISFFAVLLGWILMNAYMLGRNTFDPYPFILLNLVLSCLAAIQAPIIMMSQNRKEAKDRARSEHDYKINLKAELEIRLLHEKVDYLLTRQWQHLIEIQKMQMEVMDEMLDKKVSRKE
ncbi:MAG: DUF1003 domain-containing protein [Cytophagaceae bacterium]